MVILLDMDEVLVDFIGGACLAHGLTREAAEAFRTPGEWSIIGPIGEAIGDPEFGLDKFWAPIHGRGEAFWQDLRELPWFDEVIDMVEGTGLQWHVVSAPSNCETSYTGKVRWLKNKFGSRFDRFILSPHKELLAHEGNTLIDDREENVVKFMEGGGYGILFPDRGNMLHCRHADPVPVVQEVLSSHCRKLLS